MRKMDKKASKTENAFLEGFIEGVAGYCRPLRYFLGQRNMLLLKTHHTPTCQRLRASFFFGKNSG